MIFPFRKLNKSNVSSNFLEFLNSLGWQVSVSSHAGWTGHVQTSWRSTSTCSASTNARVVQQPVDEDEHGGALYNGGSHVLYWADVSSEVAFVVPTWAACVTTSETVDSNFSEPANGKYMLCINTIVEY